MTGEASLPTSMPQEKALLRQCSDDELVQIAEKKAAWYRMWGLIGWNAYTWLTAVSLIVSVAVPFGLAAILYLPKEATDSWNRGLLWLSAIAAACQVLTHGLRLKERAFRGRRLGAVLEGAVLKFRNGLLQKETLVERMVTAYIEEIEEEGP